MKHGKFVLTTLSAMLLGSSGALFAQANIHCPPNGPLGINIVKGGPLNGASFENCGAKKTWTLGNPDDVSANVNWKVHSNNPPNSKPVTTECITTTAPGPNGTKMMHVTVGAHESGIYQDLRPNVPARVMFSAWVFVNKGTVWIQHVGATPAVGARTTKIGQWEQLRMCTDGTIPSDIFSIFNQDPTGGDFYVDRVEIRSIQ